MSMSYAEFKRFILLNPDGINDVELKIIRDILNSRDSINLQIRYSELSYKLRNKVEQAEWNIIREILRLRNF